MANDNQQFTVRFSGTVYVTYDDLQIEASVWGAGAAVATLSGVEDEAILNEALFIACKETVKRVRRSLSKIAIVEENE